VGRGDVVEWLLAGDVAVRYQATRDLLGRDDPDLQARIADEGDGATLLAARLSNGHWGSTFYRPKWTSTHYVLLELCHLGLPPTDPVARDGCDLVLRTERTSDGGLGPVSAAHGVSDLCIDGMALEYLSWFRADPEALTALVDLLLAERMADGGFNCQRRSRATHSSVHTSVSVIEGITAYQRSGYSHRLDELEVARDSAVEFLLRHRLFRSEWTGRPISQEITRLHHPARWHYDALRGLDALRAAGTPYDDRMADALELVRGRRRADGRWAAHRGYPGETHLAYTPPGQPNPWVTLIASRVLATY
jgi:hypothetical protein